MAPHNQPEHMRQRLAKLAEARRRLRTSLGTVARGARQDLADRQRSAAALPDQSRM